ncbi:hypothetical protein QQ056_14975 [Oscillatoria laete-virens NRMC-F 0139]|nr:hypothetical protein [Oscillatoria laete-virens]MDL5054840.1 hypothetical protein [Oscillatoria laete-virens NRMC-F 0139]
MNTKNITNPIDAEFEKVWIDTPVYIPTLDGKEIAETVTHRVEALKNRKTGEIFLDGHALAELDKVKARHMGLLAPDEIRSIRSNWGLTQSKISQLLEIGEKSWTRWETGRERPSRVINLLLKLIHHGFVKENDIRAVQRPESGSKMDKRNYQK